MAATLDDRKTDAGLMDATRRGWLRTMGLGAGAATLLAGCASTGVAEIAAAEATAPEAMPTDHLPDLTAPEPGVARLSSNENPFGPSPKAVEAMGKSLEYTCRYADKETAVVAKQIAEQEGVKPEQVILANGSSPILMMYGYWIANNGGKLLTSMATYEGVPRSAQLFGADVTFVPLNADMDFDLEKIASMVTPETTAVYICNPNNPTGRALDPGLLYAFTKEVSKKTQVFLDEAYIELTDDYPASVQSKLVAEGENVVVCRTFSKLYAMAGQRLGYAILPEEYAKQLGGAVRLGGVNHLAQVAGMASLKDTENLEKQRLLIAKERMRTVAVIEELGLNYAKNPQGNFVYVDTGMPHDQFAAKMLDKGVRVVGRTWPGYDSWSRISVGLPSDTDACIAALKAVYA